MGWSPCRTLHYKLDAPRSGYSRRNGRLGARPWGRHVYWIVPQLTECGGASGQISPKRRKSLQTPLLRSWRKSSMLGTLTISPAHGQKENSHRCRLEARRMLNGNNWWLRCDWAAVRLGQTATTHVRQKFVRRSEEYGSVSDG